MNTDKIYAEQLANEYAPKDTLKCYTNVVTVVANKI